LKNGIHLNIDNFDELNRVIELREQLSDSTASVGIRINPESGAGTIAELSVSTSKSKFGISVRFVEDIIAACKKHDWINCIHVHVGSGNMSTDTLVAGIRCAVEVALRVNKETGRRQIRVLDMGGGLAADYSSDACPDFEAYAADLRREVPGLLHDKSGEPIFDRVITEFGQALNAKSGWLASRAEYVKETADGLAQIPVIHFGADVCLPQCYTGAHVRRFEFFDKESFKPIETAPKLTNIAGPLCFQGDMLAKDLQAPALMVDDVVVMREAGANTLSMFSRHCSRFAPKVLGYRMADDDSSVSELEVLKEAESIESLCAFWGTDASGTF
jgi:diaminopimelate decarboxylase